jgi:hypothetical protein
MKTIKNRIFVIIPAFLITLFTFTQSKAQEDFYVISVQDKIYLNQSLLKTKDKINSKTTLKFGSHEDKAIIISPTQGKFVLTASKLQENRKGELVAPAELVMVSAVDYYFDGTRAGTEMTIDDYSAALHDNPVDSDLITVYFIGKEPNFVFPVPANLLSKDATFYLISAKHKINIPIPIKDGKLVFSKQMLDEKGKSIDVLKTKEQFEFVYNRSNPHVIGRVIFELF